MVMAGLRITTTSYPLLPNRSRQEGKLQHEIAIPLQGSKSHAVGRSPPMTEEDQPSPPPLDFPRQQISPALAASIYQANIPTEIYAYPCHGMQQEHDGTADHIENAHVGQGHEAVTMVQYEPGILIDCHA